MHSAQPAAAPDNGYSQRWFDLFLDTVPAAQTACEVAFLTRQLPLDRFPTLLDLCCGSGRHAIPLAGLGYRVTGIDRDAAAIRRARAAGAPGAELITGDVRQLDRQAGRWHGALILWASFGFFEPAENRALLADLHARLLPGGRLVLDVFDRRYFQPGQSERVLERAGVRVVERRRVQDGRLLVSLDYGQPPGDRFSWQLFHARELLALAAELGFHPVTVCSGCDEATPADGRLPRMQIVLARG